MPSSASPLASSSPSYPALQTLLQSMEASGKKNSFEELLACLIAHLTGEHVIVAKAGSQLGDGLNDKGTIAIQAKRYQQTTALPLNEIEGELHEIVRHAPYLEVYVLGATRSAQDIPRFQRIEEETGVSLVVLDWAKPDSSALGQLCSVCWDAIRHLKPLDTLTEDWTRWFHAEASKPAAIQTVETIQREILEEPKLHSHLASLSTQHRQRQFFPTTAAQHAEPQFNQIDLSQAIPREAEALLQRWWNDERSSPLAVVRGQEGMGKSWVTAAFVHSIAQSPENAVFWLDSQEWSTCRDLKSVMERVFRYLVDEKSLPRLVSKAIRKWRKPMLIVLDGVNERDALAAAKDILRDFTNLSAKEDHPLTHIRILLTSRERVADELRTESRSVRIIPVGPYTDNELGLILPKLSRGLSISEIPALLLAQVARIPRYLPTCLRLLPELGALQQITVEIVLWHDLLLRLREDQQIRKQLSLESTGDAESILIQLARSCSLDGAVATSQLAQLFDSDYKSIRHDLQELRWLSDAKLGQPTARINPDHLRLGWALYLRETLREADGPPAIMEDRLQLALEPLGAEDHRIAALRLCGRLSLTDASGFGIHVVRKREALLRLWVKSRNIEHVNEELFFWHDRDEPFYLSFVDNLFPELLRTDARQRLILPLVRAWSGNPSDHLIAVLSRWIQMIAAPPERWLEMDWPAQLEGAEAVISGHRIPWVEDANQLFLSGAAMSIISHRADNRMLRPLALATATDKYSSDYSPPPPEVVARGHASKWNQWTRNKQLFDLCAPLMRWSYGEAALPELQKLVDENPEDEVLKYGAQWMAAFLKLESVPDQLSLPAGYGYQIPWRSDPVEELLKGKPLLASCAEADLQNCLDHLSIYDPIGCLACWDEVEWAEEDQPILELAAIGLLGRTPSRHLRGNALFSAWLARRDPKMAAACAAKAIREFRFSENSLLPDDFVAHVVPHPDDRQAVLTALRTILENAPGHDHRTTSVWPGLYIALTLKAEEWQEWIEWLEERPSARIPLDFYPIPEVLEYRIPQDVISWLHQRLLQLEFDSESLGEYGIGTFFAYLASSLDVPNAELFEKVKIWLKANQDGSTWHKMFRLWCSVAPDFPSLLQDTEQISLSSQFRHLVQIKWSRIIAKGEVFAADTPYDRLVCFVPWDELGRFLLRHQRMEDFKRWGGNVIEAVKACFENPERAPLPQGPLLRRLNASGRVESVGPPAAVFPGMHFVSAKSSWLASKSELTPNDFLQTDQGQHIEEVNQRNLAWGEWFNRESGDPGHQSRQWLFFSASTEVIEWAALYPDEFEAKAIPFLTDNKYFGTSRLGQDDNIFSGVAGAYTDAWFCLSPAVAEEYYRQAPFQHLTETDYGLATSFKLKWHPAMLANPKHTQRPSEILQTARNDLELARLTFAAQESGAEQLIWSFAQEWAESNHMRERALAVSILAWIESAEALSLLQKLKHQDSSRWVRNHAQWAIRVWKTEDYAKRLLQRVGQQTEPWLASVMLQQLHPALTFAARWWMPRDIKPLLADSTIGPDIKALLYSACYRHHTLRSSREKVWSRNLKEYWRGEKVDSQSESLAPLWKCS